MSIPTNNMNSVTQHLDSKGGWLGRIAPKTVFLPERGRYHLYIGLFCPFAHRVNLIRHLKGLQDVIDISIVKPYPKGDENGWPGWKFPVSDSEYPNATVDKLFGSEYMHEIYFKADENYKGRYSVPVLWDKHTNTIVNNESADMLRWLPTAFDSLSNYTPPSFDLYPPQHRSAIDDISIWMQRDLNTGVYKAGFAETQDAYDAAVPHVFAALNKLEKLVHGGGGPFVLGAEMTELDVRLYATLVRFDAVYVQHFKCNLGTVRHDYPVLNAWLRGVHWTVPGFKESTDFKHIKENYTKSHPGVNPKAITPMGPVPNIEEGTASDWKSLKPGRVSLPIVLELESKL